MTRLSPGFLLPLEQQGILKSTRVENLPVPGGAISVPAALCEGENESEGKPPLAGNGEEKKESSNGSLKDPKEDPKAEGIPKLSSNSWNCRC